MSLEQLDAWLDALGPEARIDGVSMMDGYLTTIVGGPFSISPDEWFDDLLGERGRIATATGKTMAVIKAIVGRFNVISAGLPTAPEKPAAILRYCTDPLGRPMRGPPREGPEKQEFLRTAYHDIPRVIPAFRDDWTPQHVKPDNQWRPRSGYDKHGVLPMPAALEVVGAYSAAAGA